MAKKTYEADYVLNLNKTINSLKAAQKQAESFDDIMSNIGDQGSLNNLIKHFVGLNETIDNLRQNTDSLVSDLGDSLKSGYAASMDGAIGKLAEMSKMTKELLDDAGSLDIADPNAAKKLENLAVKLNDVFKQFQIKGKINLSNFLTKPLDEQREKIFSRIALLNKNINTTLGNINVGKIQDEFNRAFDGAIDPINDFNEDFEDEVKKLNETKKKYEEIVKALNKENIKVKTTKKNDVEELNKLIEAYKVAESSVKAFEVAKDTSGDGYKKALAEQLRLATLLKNTMDYVADHGSDAGSVLVGQHVGGTGAYTSAEDFIEKFHKNTSGMASSIKTLFSGLINDIDNEIANFGSQALTADDMSNAIEERTNKTVDDINESKTKLVNAFKDFYKATTIAARQGVRVADGIETSFEMDEIQSTIADMLSSANLNKKAKFDLSSLTDYIVDGDFGIDDIENEIDAIIKQHGIELKIPLDYTPYDFGDGESDISDAVNEEFEDIADNADKVEEKVYDVNEAFNRLVSYITDSGKNTNKFFHELESGAVRLDDELKNILNSLNLIDQNGNVNIASLTSGYTNKGGFVSDQYTMIARKIVNEEGKNYLKKAKDLQENLTNAKQAGAQIGAIFDIIEVGSKNLFYEIQNTVPGKAAFSHHKMQANTDVLNATEEQLKEFVNTIQILTDNGLFIDWGGDNVLYDKDKGFSVIDLGVKGGYSHTVSTQNTLQENLDRFIKEMFKYAPQDMRNQMQSIIVDRMYDIANTLYPSSNIVNPNTKNTDSNKVTKANNAAATAVSREEVARENNADAINEENKALAAQIELKKKAQSMKWEDFALDDSTVDLKKQAGFQTISDMEKFWKDSNYAKEIDFYEISEKEARDIIKKKIPHHVSADWYGGKQKFEAKDLLENVTLADDELRNASLNFLYHIYKQYVPSEKQIVKNFEEFLNTDFTVFRGDSGPLIYGDESKLSFSFKKSVAKNFDSNVGTARVKPKDTIGNVGSMHESEVETFVHSYKTSWYKKSDELFEDFYNKQTQEMKKEIDAGLVALEKQRVEDLLGYDIKNAIKHSNALDVFDNNNIPDNIMSGFNDPLADVYNNLSDMQKKLVAYYVSLQKISQSMPSQFSQLTKDEVGRNANVLSAVINDPTGVKAHTASLTGELNWGLFGEQIGEIKELKNYTSAVKDNTKAVQQNVDAQQEFDKKRATDNVYYKLSGEALKASHKTKKDPSFKQASSELYDLKDKILHVEKTGQDQIDMGYTGELLEIAELYDKVGEIEQQFGINLGYVKDYLNQVYQNFNAQLDKDLGIAKSESKGKKLTETEVIDKLYNLQYDVDTSRPKWNDMWDLYYNVKYQDDNDIDTKLDVADIYNLIDKIESEYAEDLSDIKEYLADKYSAVQSSPDVTSDFDEASSYNNAINDLIWKATNSIGNDYDKYLELNNLQNELYSVHDTVNSSSHLIPDGEYASSLTGEILDVTDLLNLISQTEQEYGEDLSKAKEYLKGIYGGLEASQTSFVADELDDDLLVDFNDTSKYLSYQAAQTALTELKRSIPNWDWNLQAVSDALSEIYANENDVDFIKKGEITNSATDEIISISDLIALISDLEIDYGQKLTDAHSYLNSVYGDLLSAQSVIEDFDDEIYVELDDDDYDVNDHDDKHNIQSGQVQFGNSSANIQNEISALNDLQDKINDVVNAVDFKTQAFTTEDDTVKSVVENEIQSLERLKVYLEDLKLLINNLFDGINPSEIPTIDANNIQIDPDKIKNKVSGDYALESSLQETNSILELIFDVLTSDDNTNLANALTAATKELQDAANGIISHQKSQKADTRAASDRIADATTYKQISDVARNFVSSFGDVEIDGLTALKDGVVKVEGAFKNAQGVWEGFSIKVNDANEAVDLATKSQSAFAKALNEADAATQNATNNNTQNSKKSKGPSINSYQKKYNILSDKAQQYVGDSSNIYSEAVDTALKKYTAAIEDLEIKQKALADAENLTEDELKQKKAEFDIATGACTEYANKLHDLIKANESFKATNNKIQDVQKGLYDISDVKQAEQALRDYVEVQYGSAAKVDKFDDELLELKFTVKDVTGEVKEMTAAFDATGTAIGTAVGKPKQSASLLGSILGDIGKKSKELWVYASARFGIDEIFQQIRNGVQYVREIDTALTELKKVTDETDASYRRFLQDMSKTADAVGSTVSELTTMSAEWARLGYSMKEAGQLAKSTAILLNVSEFTDATSASEALISTMQAFQYTANESQHVVDILNEVGNNFAVSSDGLAIALQDSASALMEGGNNLEQSVALIAAANKVVQDPNSVGSALRTISLRLRGTSVEVLESIGEETDGAVEGISKLQSKIKALSGIDILDNTGAYKDTYTILKEIGAVWEDMSDMDQAALLELMAGKNRANTLSAILSNMEDLEGAYKSALNAEGSALKENDAYLDSIQGRIDIFTNALQTFWMNLIDSEMVKGIVDLGTDLIKLLDTAHGKLLAIVSAFALYKKFHDGVKFADMFNGIINVSKEVISTIKTVTVSTESLTTATIAQSLSSKKVSAEMVTEILTASGLAGMDGVLTKEKIKLTAATLTEAFTNGKLTASQYLATMSTMGLKTAIKGLWVVLTKNPIIAAAVAISALALAFDHFNTTAQEAADAAKEAFDEIQQVVDTTKSAVQSLESELSSLQDKIDEFDGKKLSFADNEELKRLQDQKEELEHSLKIQKQLLELQQQSRNKQAVASMKAYTKAASQGAEKTQETAKSWGTIGGIILGAGLVIGGLALTPVSGGTSTALSAMGAKAIAGSLAAGAIAGGVAGNKAGEAIGSSIAANDGTYDSWYETYTKALDTTREEEKKALQEYQKDSSNIDKLDKWQEAQQKTADIETEMYEHLTQMQQYYSGLEYGMSDDIDKELDTWYNFLDKLSVAEKASGAKDTALDRIFGENASEEIQLIKDEILKTIGAGQEFDFDAAINGSEELKATLAYIGLSAEDVKNYFTQIGEAAVDSAKSMIAFKPYAALSEDADKYKDILLQSNTILAEGITVTEDYYNSLIELGISEEDLGECIDKNNGFMVTNVDLLKDLVKITSKNVAADVKLAKSQSRLKYYNLYKQMRQLTNGSKDLTGATLNQVNALYDQMGAIEKTIAKYSMLEQQLLGAGNAFTEFENAQSLDEQTDYIASVESMVLALGQAFNTAELGSETAQAAIEGLVPDSVYKDLDTVNEKMAAINKYFKEGQLSRYFDIQFSEDGSIESAEMKLSNLRNFIEDGLKNGVFVGESWTNFDLAEGIDSLDELASRMGTTDDVAFAFLKSLEDHDIEWLNGDYSSLLEKLLPKSLEQDIYNNISALADLEHQLANGKISAEQYGIKFNELNQKSQELAVQSREDAALWYEKTEKLEEYKNQLKEYYSQLESGKDSAGNVIDPKQVQNNIDKTVGYINDLTTELSALEEPTEVTLQLAIDDINKDLKGITDQIGDVIENTHYKFDVEAGEYKVILNKDDPNYQEVVDYVNLLNEQYTLSLQMGDDAITVTDQLSTIASILERIAQVLDKEYNIDVDTSDALTNTNKFLDLWNSISSSKNITFELGYTMGQKLREFFGGLFVNGTAHTAGTAYATGNWGLPKAEHDSLVGELGQELVVDPHTGRYYTVGDRGAEFVDLPKDAIIFNHQQTKDLLSHGHVTGRGKAYAEGNAHVSIYPDGSSDDENGIAKDKTEELIDFIEIKLEDIESIIAKTSAELVNKKDNASDIVGKSKLYDTLIGQEKAKETIYREAKDIYNNKAAWFLEQIPDEYEKLAQGLVKVDDETAKQMIQDLAPQHAEAINNYREWSQKADNAETEALNSIAQQAAYRLEQLEDIASDYDNLVNFVGSKSDLIEAEMSLMEEFGAIQSPDNYKALIDNSYEQIGYLQNKKIALEKELQDAVSNGDIIVGTDEWYEAKSMISDVDAEIIQCKEDIVAWGNEIENLRWDSLDRLMTRLEAIDSQMSHIVDRLTDGDVVDDAGNWTDKGIAAMGTLFQQMELAQTEANKYGKEIEQLQKDFKAGVYKGREEVYYEKLEELTEKQWESIEAYESTKDSIIDLNKTRIDAVKDGMDKELDAYKELIDKKKEALDADKDAYDFEKNVAKQEKDIAKIRRKIDALDGDTSSSAAAQRKQLMADLLETEEELKDTYSDRSIEQQKEALDKEYNQKEDNINDEKEALDKYLTDEEQVILDSMNVVKSNTDVVLSEIKGIANQYGIAIAAEITSPWEKGKTAIADFSTNFNTFAEGFTVSAFTGKLQTIVDKYGEIEEAARLAANAMFDSIDGSPSNIGTSTSSSGSSLTQKPAQAATTSGHTVAKGDTLWSIAEDVYGNGSMWKDIYNANKDVIKDPNKIYIGQELEIPQYAKGTTGVKDDQFAWIDEVGEELVLHADSNGRLAYLSKGSSVIPSDLTKKLLELAVDPTQTLEYSRPIISAPHIVNNEINVEFNVAEVVHIDTVTNDTMPDLTKAVEKQMDKYMKQVNSQIRKYAR